MEISTRAKRAFETPETAPYKRQVLPKLNAELGVPADPRRLAPPTDPSLPSGAPTPMPMSPPPPASAPAASAKARS